jgi:subtilisin family serine protease
LGALGPLAFLAPAQTSVIVNSSGRDVGFWALVAAGCGLVVGLVLSILYGVGLRRTPRPVVGVVASLAMVAAGVTGYVTVGAPGFHGDRLFVVMREQADLTRLPTAVPARRAEVYRRLVDTADRTQAGLRKDLSRLHIRYTPYYLVNGIEVDGGPAVREWLSTRSDVDRVLLSPYLRPIPAGPDPMQGTDPAPIGPQWNVTMLHADQVWATGDRGQGIVIGASDTGVDGSHPALAGAFRGGDDSWYDPWNGTRTPTDHNGHGTHTLGSALGGNGIGVAPGAQWMGCVDLDRDLGNPPYYLDCLQFMLAPYRHGGDPLRDGDPTRAADVLTNSWGCPGEEGCDRSALRPAIDALTAAGIFVVAAAGNTGVSLSGGPRCGSITDPPSPYPDAFTVGAVDRTGAVADFSSRGPVAGATKPDVLAPGDGVLSALPGGGYGTLSGTSMATPHVAGVVALMWAANPALAGDVARTAQILRQTASAPPDDGCGGHAGIVDAAAAVAAAKTG